MRNYFSLFFKTGPILLVLTIGIFIVYPQITHVQATNHDGRCYDPSTRTTTNTSRAGCIGPGLVWISNDSGTVAPNDPVASQQLAINPVPRTNDGGSFLSWLNPLKVLGWTSLMILQIANFVLWLSGVLLNTVIQYTVVNMSDNISAVKTINNAWQVIRDLSNIGFIFVLLYAAIETILGMGKDNQRLIVKIVVVAVLVNFSLFFTQFVIDASNVLAITFYDAIAPNSLEAGASGAYSGIANSLMEPLKIQTLWQTTSDMSITGRQLIIIGVMGTIVSLIAAFVFFAVALMFIIRFVVLIFVLVLSPIAFVSFILPKMDQYRKQWVDALTGQAFFAPIYFLLTWIVIVIARGMFDTSSGTLADAFVGTVRPDGRIQAGHVGIIMNFLIIIAMLIFSLTTAKEWASKGGAVVGKMTSWATGAAGATTLGLGGWAGRATVGRAASRLAQNENFQRFAGRSVVGQKLFQATNATAKSSFDLRATRVGEATVGGLGAGQAKTGGFEATLQKKIEKKDKVAQSLRSNASKEAYAQRIAGGPFTRGGSRSSPNTIFGVLGRQNRVVAAKILNDRITKLQTDLNTANTELTRYQNILAQPTGVLTPTQAARHAILTAGVGTPGSVADIQNNVTNLQNQADRLGLNNLTAAQQAANIAARTAGAPAPHRGTRADEQRF